MTMTLSDEEMKEILEDAHPIKVGEADWACINCGETLHAEIYMDPWEIDDQGHIAYDSPYATAECSCGAYNLLAWQPGGEAMVYWVNQKEEEEKEEEKQGNGTEGDP